MTRVLTGDAFKLQPYKSTLQDDIMKVLYDMAYPYEHFEEEDLDKIYACVTDRKDEKQIKEAIIGLNLPQQYLKHTRALAAGWCIDEDELYELAELCAQAHKEEVATTFDIVMLVREVAKCNNIPFPF